MQDRKGNELSIGDRVFVLPCDRTRTGGAGWVRRIRGDRARVDDGEREQQELAGDESWSWSAWVNPGEVEKVAN